MANVTVNGEPVQTRERAIHYAARIQYARDAMHFRVVELLSEDYFRIQIDGITWQLLRSTDSRKSPRIGILYDDGNSVQPLYLQAYASPHSEITKQMAIFGRMSPTVHDDQLPTTFFYVRRLEYVSGPLFAD